MANHKSAEKRQRQNEKKRIRNREVRSTVRTETKKLRQALEKKEPETINAQFTTTTKTLQKAASKGVMKKQTISRRISRLAKRTNEALSAPTQG